jgi:hypothetical protein
LGIQAILLVISDELIEKRVRLRSEQTKDNLSDASYKSLADDLQRQQRKLLIAAEKTTLPCRIIYTDSMNWDEYARKIVHDDGVAE